MPIETVATFHPKSGRVCAWSNAEGVTETLSKLGYGVVEFDLPSSTKINLDTLKRVDAILMIGPEFFADMLAETYGAEWSKLKATKVAWYTETASRDDGNFDFGGMKVLSDIQYYPGIQDAETFGGHWLPFGVDTDMFFPKPVEKICDVGFVGQIYPKRAEYLKSINFPLAHIEAKQDPNLHRSVHYLAEAYCAPEIFVNLPAYSRLLVGKITEVMACGTMVVTPKVDHPSGVENMRQFEHGRHLVYYDQSNPEGLREILHYYTVNKAARDEIALAGFHEVRRSHSLADRLRKIIADIEYGARPMLLAEDGESAGRTLGSTRDWSIKKYKLKTVWETLVYFDLEARLLRHGSEVDGPHNVFLTTQNLRGQIVALETNGETLKLGFEKHGSGREPGQTSGQIEILDKNRPSAFDVAFVDPRRIYLRHANKFLSADPDGVIRNDRTWTNDHETFTLVEAG